MLDELEQMRPKKQKFDESQIPLDVYGKKLFYSFVITEGDEALPGYNYCSEYWEDANDHSKGSFGKCYDLTQIPAIIIIFIKVHDFESRMFVSHCTIDSNFGSETLISPGTYVYQMSGITPDGLFTLYTGKKI